MNKRNVIEAEMGNIFGLPSLRWQHFDARSWRAWEWPRRRETSGEALRASLRAHVRALDVVVGVDYTRSNLKNGGTLQITESLHRLSDVANQYEKVLDVAVRALHSLDAERPLHVYGFGDKHTRDFGKFAFLSDGELKNVDDAMKRDRDITPLVELSGPTSYNAVMEEGERRSRTTPTVVVLVTDSSATRRAETEYAFKCAAEHAMVVLVVGVGHGPWPPPNYARDAPFQNMAFIDFQEISCSDQWRERLESLVFTAFRDQFNELQRRGMIERC